MKVLGAWLFAITVVVMFSLAVFVWGASGLWWILGVALVASIRYKD